MTRSGRIAALVCLVLLALLPAVPARADTTAPRITSLQLGGQPHVGSVAAVKVQSSDAAEPGSGVRYVTVGFDAVADDGRVVGGMSMTCMCASGWAVTTDVLGPWTAAGRWQAVLARVSDYAGNETLYSRDGTVTTADPNPPPALDLSTLDFTLTNAGQDIATPVVDSIAPVRSTVRPGEPVVVGARLRDDRSQVGSFGVTYTSPSGHRFGVNSARGLEPAGIASGVLPLGSEPGTWRASLVVVSDRAGNSQVFDRDGSGGFGPTGVRPFTDQPPLDWSQLDLTVQSDQPADTSPPTLQTVALSTPRSVRAGDFTRMSFTADDPSRVRFAMFTFTDSQGHQFRTGNSCSLRSEAGSLVQQGLTPGPLTLQEVYLADTVGNDVRYRRDGSTLDDKGDVGSHSLDLSALDLTLVTGQGPGTVPADFQTCNDATAVTMAAPSSALRGSTVTVSGTVLKAGQPVVDGTVALYRTDVGTNPRLLAFTTTDLSGSFQQSLALGTPTTVRAEFLGTGDAREALGPARTIRWRRGVSFSGAATSGPIAGFRARVVPGIAGARVFLQWLTPRGWDTAAIGTTDSTGTVVLRYRPPLGSRRYRAAAGQTDTWALAYSPTLVQRRTS